jgi:hypothetical protein
MPELTMSSDFDDDVFRKWYDDWATKYNMNPNPDDPSHKYDYRGAFAAGVNPPDVSKGEHWPSMFKADDHPNRFVDGIDTKTGEPANESTGVFTRSLTEPIETNPDLQNEYMKTLQPPTPKMGAREFLDKSGWSNLFSTAATALDPNSFGGRLGAATLNLNQRNLENLIRADTADASQKVFNDKMEAKDRVIRSLIAPGKSGRSLLEAEYPEDEQRQSLSLGMAQLGDTKGVESILQRPALDLENKAIGAALESVDPNASANEQRSQFIKSYSESGVAGSMKEAAAIARLLVPDRESGLSSPTGKQVEDRAKLVEKYGEDSSEVGKFDELAGSREMGTFRTLHGPEGATKEAWIPRGKEFVPEKGWSLTKPESSAGKTIPASKVKLGMDTIKNQISARTKKMPFEMQDDENLQSLLLEAQEMIESGKSTKEAWSAIENRVPMGEVEVEKPGLIERAFNWINEKLGPSKPKTLAPPTPVTGPQSVPKTAPTSKTEERISVIAPDGRTGSIPASQLEEALANGYKRK